MSPEDDRPETPEDDGELELVPFEKDDEPPSEEDDEEPLEVLPDDDEPPREEHDEEPIEENDEEPFQLEMLPDDDEPSAPIVVPQAEDEPAEAEAGEEDSEEEEEEEPEPPPDPPTLSPLQWIRILQWPFAGSAGSSLLGMLLLAMFFLAFGWVLGAIGFGIGTTLRMAAGAFVGYFLLGYARHVILASVEGSPEPPAISVASDENTATRDGIRGLALVGLYAFPAALLLFLTRPGPTDDARSVFSTISGLVLALGGWSLFPASLLLGSVTGRLDRADPRRAFRLTQLGGARSLIVLLPGAATIIARFLVSDRHFSSVLIETAGLFVLVLTAYMLGLLAREAEGVTEYLLEVEERDTEEEEEGRAL